MNSRELAKRIRLHSLRMTHAARSSHVGSCLSVADILAVYYSERGPGHPDRLIVSKGHAAAAVYAALAETGHFPLERLSEFCKDGSAFTGMVSHKVPGVLLSTGSLGHGLPVACGLALADRRRQVYCVLSDAELDCGTTWETALIAAHHQLWNLTVIIDHNGLQALGPTHDVLSLYPVREKFWAFRWTASVIDGHNHANLFERFAPDDSQTCPRVVIANTIKGKGVSFMEHNNDYHYRTPSDDDLTCAIAEVETWG